MASEVGPYRPAVSPSWQEEELWHQLDEALECALRDAPMAWTLVWGVLQDSLSLGFFDVHRAASALAGELADGKLLSDWDFPRFALDIPDRNVAVEDSDEH